MLQPLQNTQAHEGDKVILECVIPPHPQPESVHWYRNEVQIHSSPDYQVMYANGVCSLIISEVFPEDSGKFTCTIIVNGASNQTSMYLRVDRKSTHSYGGEGVGLGVW